MLIIPICYIFYMSTYSYVLSLRPQDKIAIILETCPKRLYRKEQKIEMYVMLHFRLLTLMLHQAKGTSSHLQSWFARCNETMLKFAILHRISINDHFEACFTFSCNGKSTIASSVERVDAEANAMLIMRVCKWWKKNVICTQGKFEW